MGLYTNKLKKNLFGLGFIMKFSAVKCEQKLKFNPDVRFIGFKGT